MATVRNEYGQYTQPDESAPPVGEQSTRQVETTGPGNFLSRSFIGGGVSWGNGGTWENPCAFPSYAGLYTGTYQTYRWMLQHPTIRLVRCIATAPIIASTWSAEKAREDAQDGWVKLITDMFMPLRRSIVENCVLHGRDFGHQEFEPIWEIRDGQFWIERMKPLLQDISELLADEKGNFTGVRQQQGDDLLAPYKCWKYTYDSEAGNHYGRSWLENLRETAWTDWLDCAQQLKRMGVKLSGVFCVVMSPSGTFKDETGADVTYRQNAIDAITGLAKGAAGAWIPSLGMLLDPAKLNPDQLSAYAELAKASLTNFELLDFGSYTPAISGLLERMKHDEEKMFDGGLRPSRTGLEGKHGTKAESGVMTDTGILAAEQDDDNLAGQLQKLVDAVLVLNKGERARGAVRIKPAPLVNRKADIFSAALDKAIGDPTIGPAILQAINLPEMLKQLDIPVLKDVDVTKLVTAAIEQGQKNADAAAKAAQQQQPMNGNGPAPSNGNGGRFGGAA